MLRRIPLMHTLARPPVREASRLFRSAQRAFTLIELLTVIAIIAILAAITFGVVKGVNERAAIGQAKAELASLAQALEAYKLQYGDYPRSAGAANSATATSASATDAPGILFNSLVGKLGPYRATSNPNRAPMNGKSLVELTRFTLQSTATADMPSTGTTASVANAFLDPWGRRYLYYYKTGTAATPPWSISSYILLSVGPNGGAPGFTLTGDTGVITVSGAANITLEADNLYANSRPPQS